MLKAPRPSSLDNVRGVINASGITVREKISGRPVVINNNEKDETENNPTDGITDAEVTPPSQSPGDSLRNEGGKLTWAQVVATRKALENATFAELIQRAMMMEEQAADRGGGLPGTASTRTDKVCASSCLPPPPSAPSTFLLPPFDRQQKTPEASRLPSAVVCVAHCVAAVREGR